MTTELTKIKPIPPSERAELKRRGLEIPEVKPVEIEPVIAPTPISTILPSGIIERAPVFPKIPTVEEADAAMKRLYPDVPDMQIGYMQAFADQDTDAFVDEIRRQGRTPDTEIILKSLNLPDLSVDEIFNEQPTTPQRAVVDISGVRQLVSYDVNTGATYDKDGNSIGTFNPISKKIEPKESFFKDFWDTLHYASRQYWESFEGFTLSVLPNIIYPEIDPKAYGGLGGFMNETNRQMRDNFRWLYNENKKEYETWIKKNPEIVPDVKFQEGAYKHPELLKDPRYYAYELANIVPFIVASTGVALATGGVGLPFVAGTAALMAPIEGQQVYEDLINAGAPEGKAADMALVAGGLIGLLESVGRIPLLKQVSPLLFRKFKQEATRELAKRTMWEVAKRYGKNFTISEFSEVSTEVMQEVVGNVAVSFYDKNRSVLDNLPDIAVKTAVATLLPSGLGGVVSVRPEIREDIAGAVDKFVSDERGFIGFQPEPSPESILVSLRQQKADLEKELATKYNKETEALLRTTEFRIRDLQEKMEAVPEKVAPVPEVKFITIEGRAGGYQASVASDKGIKVPVGDLSVTPEKATASATKILTENLALLEKDWVKQGHTFQKAAESLKVVLPTAVPGMPEAGVQETMLPAEVSAKEVFPRGKGVPTQISMDEAAKLRAMEQEAKARLPVTPEEIKAEAEEGATREFQNRMELEALKEEQAADPASKFIDIVAKAGSYKGEINTLTRHQYRLLTGAEWRTQTAEIGGKKVTKKILVGGSEPTPGMMEMEGGISTGRVRWEYALDTVATEQGFESGDAFKVAIEKALERKHTIDALEGVVTPVPKPTKAEVEKAKAKPLALLPEFSLEEQQRNITPTGLPKLTMQQVDVLVGFFGEYLENPNTVTAWELTRELRRESRQGRAELLKARAQELIVSKGLNAEEGMKQAIREALSGELPVMTTGYFEGMVSDLRDALFIKVYNTLKDEPLEMASTITALSNALSGRPIPREPGVKGGSAFTRLQRVFGDQPKVLKAIDKMASENKPLKDVVEGIYHETGREPIPIDQETADYLRRLSEIPFGQAMLGERYQPLPPLPLDTRTPSQKQTDLQAFKLELTPDQYKNWTPERLEHLSFLRINLLTSDYQAKLIESKWIPPKPLAADLRTPAQRALDLQEFATELAPAPVGVSKPIYEAPIEDAFKQKPLTGMTFMEKKMLVKVFKEIGWTAVDIGNFLRAMKVTIDNSFLRQGKVLAAGHPLVAFKAHNTSWRAMFNQSAAEASWERIIRKPWFPIYEQIRIETGHDPLRLPAFAARKGTARYRTAEEYGFPTVERWIPRITAKLPTIRPFERAFSAGTNEIVAGIMDIKYAETLRRIEKIASGQVKLKVGESFDIVQEMTDHQGFLADLIQRGTLPEPTRGLAPVFNAFFFALRSKLGRFLMPTHLLGITRPTGGLRIGFNRRVMKEAWKDFILINAEMGGIMFLGSWLGLWDLEDDPRNAEVMSARIGNTRIDPWAGYRQFAVLYARLVTKTGISSVTGAEYEVNPKGAVQSFIENSLSPMASTLLEFWTGRNFLGAVIDFADKKYWVEKITAMSLWDIWEAFEDAGWGRAAQVAIPAIYGEGVQTYTGDWEENFTKLGLPKYLENTDPKYDAGDIWSDTASQFKGVDPESLTAKKGYPAYVKAMAEAQLTKEYTDFLPNEKLISINADPMLGGVKTLTFVDYHNMWMERQKLVDAGNEAEYIAEELQPDGKYKKVTYKGEDAVTAYDKDERHTPAMSRLGNFTQAQLSLLTEYWTADKAKQKELVEKYPELGQNLYDEWYKSHAKENAILAVHGKMDVLTEEAYKLAIQFAKEWDYPDSAIEPYLPPKDMVKPHFERIGIVDKFGANSWEDKLFRATNLEWVKWHNKNNPDKTLDTVDTPPEALRLKIKHRDLYDLSDSYSDKESPNYIAEDKLREKALKKLKTDNPVWVDDIRRIEAIEHNGLDKSESWVARGKIVDQFTGGSSEAKVWLLDHPDVHNWALEQELLTDDGADWNEAVLRINATWRKQDEEYDAIDPDIVNPETNIRLRDEYLAKNIDFRIARRQSEFYSLVPDTTDELRDKYVGFTELPDKGYFKEHFLLDNPDLEAILTNPEIMKESTRDRVDPTTVPDKMYDQLYLEFQEEFDKWDAYGNGASPNFIPDEKQRERARDRLVLNNRDFQIAMWKRDGYKLFIGNEGQVDNYVGWQVIADKGKPKTADYWFDDNWFLLDHPDFYKAMTDMYVKTDGKQGWKPGAKDKELSRTPTREIYALYLVYDAIIGSEHMSQTEARKEFRRRYPLLDAWLFLIGAVSKTIEQQDAEAKVTKAETLARSLSEKRLVIDRLRDELDRKLRALGIK